jgi:hypothetical protein
MGPVQKAISEHEGATGLVVIITNDYFSTPNLSELKGTEKDGHALSHAFGLLNFAVCWKTNVSGNALCQIIREMGSLKSHQVRGFQAIIFVFAGHGCEGDSLWMQDRTKLHIIHDVVDPLLPKNAKEIGNVKKAFLVDACRGEQPTQTTLVPRSNSVPGSGGSDSRGSPDSRGGSLVDMTKVCGDGNFLIAYSTLPKHKAYENTGSGGVWLSTLAELLFQNKSLFSLEYLLTEVNEEMVNKMQGSSFQQPEKLSRLNGHLSLESNLMRGLWGSHTVVLVVVCALLSNGYFKFAGKAAKRTIAAVFPSDSGAENSVSITDVQKTGQYARNMFCSNYARVSLRACGLVYS